MILTRSRFVSSMLALAGLAGCATPATTVEPSPQSEPGSQVAPFPFTAEQIRDGSPVGSVRTYRTQEKGKPPFVAETRVAAADENKATFVTTMIGGDGEAVGEAKSSTASWTELVQHAKFDAALTSVEDVVIDTPAGSFRGWLYTVRKGPEEPLDLARYYFAKKYPGAPIKYEQVKAGVTVFKVELLK